MSSVGSLVDAMAGYNVRAFLNLGSPIMETPVLGPGVSAGSVALQYAATFVTIDGESLPCSLVSISNAPAVLSGANTVLLKVNIPNIPPEVKTVNFYKQTAGGLFLLGGVAATVGYMFDMGQAVGTQAVPVVDQSGRPDWLALGYHPGEWRQRQEGMDDQAIRLLQDQKLWGTIFSDGDIVKGLSAKQVSANVWNFANGFTYWSGRIHGVPAPPNEGNITLAGTGKEVVGIVPTVYWVTLNQDPILTAATDEGQPPATSAMGADRLMVSWTWGINQVGQIPIQTFTNGVSATDVVTVQRTQLDITLAAMVYAQSGNFVVLPFGTDVSAYPADNTQLTLTIKKGEAWVQGYPIVNSNPIPIEFSKARATQLINNSGTDSFVCPGGSVTTSLLGPFNVDGLTVALTIGSGAAHTVGLAGTSETATQVAAQITSALNAIPTSGALVTSEVAGEQFTIWAPDGKALTVGSGTANSVLGWTAGTCLPIGTRIYKLNDNFIKDTSQVNYKHEFVGAVSHNGSTHIDTLPNSNVVAIIGASITQARCNDGAFDYQLNKDFVKSGNNISFAGMGAAEPVSGTTYFVKFQVEYNATQGTRQLVKVVDAQITKGAIDSEDTIMFTAATSMTKVVDGTAVSGLSGAAMDVNCVLQVNDIPGQTSSQYNAYCFAKNSTALALGNGKLDWAFAGEPATGIAGQPQVNAVYYATFLVWAHVVEGDFTSASSYDMYEQIESFGGLLLRDCLDFRTVNGLLPVPGENPILDYDYYLSRIDLLVLDQYGNFSLVTGTSALNPIVPQTPTGVMALAIINVSPYTYSLDNVVIQPLMPIRLQQSDLQSYVQQIQKMQYNEANTQLASEVAGSPVAAQATGIYSDALTGFGNMDLQWSATPDINGTQTPVACDIAVDLTNQMACIPADQTCKQLDIDTNITTGVVQIGDTLVLEFEPSVLISQPLATGVMNLNPDDIISFTNGTIHLSPATCVFNSVNQLPDLNVDFDNNLSPLLQALAAANPDNVSQVTSQVYGAWRVATPTDATASVASGGSSTDGGHTNEVAETLMGETWQQVGMNATFAQTVTQTNQTLAVNSMTSSLGNRVVDVSLLPMMETTNSDGSPYQIHISGSALKPNTAHAVTIAGIVADLSVDSSVSPSKGTAGGSVTYQSKTTVIADAYGCLTAVFNMPSGVAVGSQTVSVFDAATGTASKASAQFSSTGWATDQQSTTIGYSSLVTRDSTSQITNLVTSWGDPIAQSFLTPDNMDYVAGLNLYFATKDPFIPVTVDIRAMSNGYPTRTVLASVTVQASDILVSSDGSVPTPFMFENILGYQKNEYCFVAISNCDSYTVYNATMGLADIASGNIVQTRPYNGVVFHSPNNSTWEAMDQVSLKFDIIAANFVNNCHIRFSALSGIQASVLALRVDEFLAPGTTASWTYQPSGSTNWFPFNPALDVTLQDIITSVTLDVNVTSLGGSYQLVSQVAGIVLCLHRSGAYYVSGEMFESDPLTYPNKLTAILDLDCDGVNGVGTRSITPYYTVDEGLTLVEIFPEPGFAATGLAQQPLYRWEFVTPEVQTIDSATNTTPIHVNSTPISGINRFQNNAVVTIAGVAGNTNANGTWRVKNTNSTGFDIVDPVTGVNSVGNGTSSGAGTVELTEFKNARLIVSATTSNTAVTPRLKSVNFVPAQV